MRYEVLNPLSFFGGRVERGEVIDLTAEEAANYGADLVCQCIDAEVEVDPLAGTLNPRVENAQPEPTPQVEETATETLNPQTAVEEAPVEEPTA